MSELQKLFPLTTNNADSGQQTPSILHLWGNHEFYNFSRKECIQLVLNTARALGQEDTHKPKDGNYYTYDVTDRLRLICLDFYKFSALGYDQNDSIFQAAIAKLRVHNKNEVNCWLY